MRCCVGNSRNLWFPKFPSFASVVTDLCLGARNRYPLDLLVSCITNTCYVLQRLLELNFLPINLYKALNQGLTLVWYLWNERYTSLSAYYRLVWIRFVCPIRFFGCCVLVLVFSLVSILGSELTYHLELTTREKFIFSLLATRNQVFLVRNTFRAITSTRFHHTSTLIRRGFKHA